MSTSPGPGVGLGTDFTVKPGARSSLTIACMNTRDAGSEMRDALEDGSGESAIHLKYGAGNIAGPFGRQKHDGSGELLRCADSPEGGFRQSLLDHLGTGFRQLFDSLGRDESRADAVYRDAVLCDFVRQRLGKAEDASARRARQNQDRKSTRLNSSHDQISYAVFCLKKKRIYENHSLNAEEY